MIHCMGYLCPPWHNAVAIYDTVLVLPAGVELTGGSPEIQKRCNLMKDCEIGVHVY